MKMLRKGSVGKDVKVLTGLLINMGYLEIPPYESWLSIFGSRTDAAVRHYQTMNGLEVDGIVGPLTWGSLLAKRDKPETAHFKFEEFACPDGTPIPDEYYGNLQRLMEQLEILRHANGDHPIIIRSGYRAPAYNAKVGGEGGSRHLYAAAADIYCPNRNPNCYTIGQRAYKQFYGGNIGGVGLGANVNVHVDVRGRRAVWWYTYKNWDEWKRNQG